MKVNIQGYDVECTPEEFNIFLKLQDSKKPKINWYNDPSIETKPYDFGVVDVGSNGLAITVHCNRLDKGKELLQKFQVSLEKKLSERTMI